MCRKLLSQPYVSPIYAMLLYQWLLVNKDAGGAEQRQKHVNLLVAGAPPLHPPARMHAHPPTVHGTSHPPWGACMPPRTVHTHAAPN